MPVGENFLNPMWVRVTYSGVTKPHHMTLCVSPSGDPITGEVPNVYTSIGTTTALDEGLGGFFNIFKAMFSPSVSFGLAEVFFAALPTDSPRFITAFNLAIVGTAGVEAPVKWGRFSLQFKTRLSGALRIVGLESNIPVNEHVTSITDLESSLQTTVLYMLGPDCIITGRDNEFPLAWASMTSKTDDTLRKKGGGA